MEVTKPLKTSLKTPKSVTGKNLVDGSMFDFMSVVGLFTGTFAGHSLVIDFVLVTSSFHYCCWGDALQVDILGVIKVR